MPLTGPAKPHPKDEQLARGEKRHHRKVASAKTWAKIVDEKKGSCRCASLGGCGGPVTFHHVVPRAHSGDDVADNIVPVCDTLHSHITGRAKAACRALVLSLTDGEYAYAVNKVGEDVWERFYGIEYEGQVAA